ncbi:MAG: acylphosphatase [Clostridia bacterium]|nr:acylphosphatase [Clostridia bacterium]
MGVAQGRWRIVFYGRVQHVGFRYTAMYLAQSLHLTGWVRNLPDGSVLMEAQGGVAQLRKLLIRLKSQPHLHIEKANISMIPLQPYERHFRVLSSSDDEMF